MSGGSIQHKEKADKGKEEEKEDFRVPLNWQTLPTFRGFPTTKKHIVITREQCRNLEYPSGCKGRLRHAGKVVGGSFHKHLPPLGLTAAHTVKSSHFNKLSHVSQIRKKKKTTQFPRNTMQFLYISPSELAAHGTEIKQEASDNIMSIFFSLFLSQHKHRLL